MKVQLPTGVILESENQSIYEQFVKHGGKEVVEKTTSSTYTRKNGQRKQKED